MEREIPTSVRLRRRVRLSTIAALASVALLVILSQAGPGLASSKASCVASGSETISADKASYQAGDTVAFTGNGYASGCDVTVEVTKPDSSKNSGTLTTEADGTLSTQYTLAADAASGTYEVKALDGDDHTLAQTHFTVEAAVSPPAPPASPPAPAAAGPCAQAGAETLDTGAGPYQPNDTVQITGTSYGASCQVTVRITRPDGSTGSTAATTGADGSLSYGYPVPSDAAPGAYTVEALGSGDAVLASAAFDVNAAPGTPCLQFGSELLHTDAQSYATGKTVHIAGGGFSHLCTVVVRVTRPDGTSSTDSASTDLGGQFDSDYALPFGTPEGQYTVVALGFADVELATTTFTVAPAGEPVITTDRAEYGPGQTVRLSGSGFSPGETVNIVFHRESGGSPDSTFASVANSNGDFSNNQFVLADSDQGVTFAITATGATSDRSAQTAFNDADAVGDFRTHASGNWSATSTWEQCTALVAGVCTWTTPALHTPTSADGVVSIRSAHNVAVTADVTVDQVVMTGASTTTVTVNSGVTLTVANGAGTDFSMGENTNIAVNGSLSIASGALLAGGGGNSSTNGDVAVNSGATLSVTGSISGTGEPISIHVNSGGTMNVTGALTDADGGSSAFKNLNELTVSGTLNVTGTGSVALGPDSSANLAVTGGNVTVKDSATLSMSRSNGGTLGSDSGTIALQDSATMSIIFGTATYTVASGGTLDMGPSTIVNGTGSLAVASGGNLKIGSTDGITNTTTNGNVRTGATDSYSAGGNYEYKATAAQATGNALPATVNDLKINNSGPANVTLSGSVIVSHDLALLSGDLVTGASNAVLEAAAATTSGTTDVVGRFIRTAPGTGNLTYGNPNNQIQTSSAFSSTAVGTLSAIQSLGATTASVNETATPPAVPFIILIGSEQELVTARTLATPHVYTVVRGVNGTTAVSHASASSVSVVGQISVNLAKNAPTSPAFSSAVQRTYTITQSGGSAFTATVQLHYNDTELNGNSESILHLWKNVSGTWTDQDPTGASTTRDTTNNWVKQTGISSFSDWTLAAQSDTTPPTSAITFPVDSTTYTSATWTAGCSTASTDDICGTASDTGSGVQKVDVQIVDNTASTHWDGSAFVAGTSGFVTATGTTGWNRLLPGSSLTNGHNYTVTSKATDNASLAETSPPSVSFTYQNDTTAPDVTIVSTIPATIGAAGSSIVKWNADEAGTFNVRLGSSCASGHSFDSGSYTSGNHDSTIDAASLSPGANTIIVCVTDAATNPGSETTTVTKDTTPPEVPTLTAPTDGSTIGDTTPTLDWSSETASGATNYDYQLVTKGVSCDFTGATPTNTASDSATVGPLTDNTYCWRVRSVDAYSNPSAYSGAFEFTLDTTPPTVTINKASTQDDPTNTGPIHFTAVFSEPVTGFTGTDVTLSASTAGGTLAATVGEIAPNDGTTYDVSVSGMTSSGTVVASIGAGRATDGGGNGNDASSSTDNSVLYDIAAPGPSTISFPTSGSYNATTWNAGCSTPSTGDICGATSDTGGSGVEKVVVSVRQGTGNYWNDSSFGSATEVFSDGSVTGGTSWNFPFAFSNFSVDDQYTFHVKAKDNAGNFEGSPTITITIDSTTPNTFIDTNPTNPTNSTSAAFTYHSDDAGATFECKRDAEVSFASCPSSGKSYSGLALGSHTFYVRAVDAATNTDPTPASYTWQIHATSSILYNGDQIVVIGSSLKLQAQVSSSSSTCLGGRTVTFTITADPTDGVGTYVQTAPTNSSGVASTTVSTTGWLEGAYDLTATVAATALCDAATDQATLTVASPGDAATGGGWYTAPGNGRSNFGFTVKKVPNTSPVQYKGQLVLVNNGKWRLKGTLSSYVKTSTSQGGASGTGNLFRWDSTLNGGLGGWALAQADVTYTISFTDSGQGGKNSNDAFGIHIDYSGSVPNSAPQSLKGGDIRVT